ncbi:MAG: hypothetical protein LBO64_01250 [Desulfovibrio sp.]|nr:hypothetical protein [Desulfovibrio sp.]
MFSIPTALPQDRAFCESGKHEKTAGRKLRSRLRGWTMFGICALVKNMLVTTLVFFWKLRQETIIFRGEEAVVPGEGAVKNCKEATIK